MRARSFHDTLAVLVEAALPAETLEYRLLCFLDLQNQRIVAVGAFHHDDECARSDAADADDFHSDVDAAVLFDELARVGGEGLAVAGEGLFDDTFHTDDVIDTYGAGVFNQVAHGDDRWRNADDA